MAHKVRICSICKKNINTKSKREDFFIETLSKMKKCYHCDCFIKYKMGLRTNKKTEEEWRQYIEDCRNSKGYIPEKNIRFQLYDFIMEMYDMTLLPQAFFTKMDKVFTGEYRGLSKPVPPEDLFDMWQQKKNYLLKVYDKNKSMGKEMEGTNRIFYDLAVLLGKYNDYLAWKEKQKLALEQNEVQKENIIEYSELKRSPQTASEASKKEDCMDLSDMLDDI